MKLRGRRFRVWGFRVSGVRRVSACQRTVPDDWIFDWACFCEHGTPRFRSNWHRSDHNVGTPKNASFCVPTVMSFLRFSNIYIYYQAVKSPKSRLAHQNRGVFEGAPLTQIKSAPPETEGFKLWKQSMSMQVPLPLDSQQLGSQQWLQSKRNKANRLQVRSKHGRER
jgi:hypothetical protein